jgi:hypothetical protein
MLLVEMFLSILLLAATGYSVYLTYTKLYTDPDPTQAKKLVMIQVVQILVTIGLLVAAATTSKAPPPSIY